VGSDHNPGRARLLASYLDCANDALRDLRAGRFSHVQKGSAGSGVQQVQVEGLNLVNLVNLLNLWHLLNVA